MFRVHEFAQLAGVTVKALHHYDRLGLLKPRRADSGYRIYVERDLERLEQIVALKFLGLPLKQIKILLEREATAWPLMHVLVTAYKARLPLTIATIIQGERIGEHAITSGVDAKAESHANEINTNR